MKNKKKQVGLYRKKARMGYLFTAHWLIGYLAFTIFPLGFSIFMSTRKVSISAQGLHTAAKGIDNYIYAFTMDFKFLLALWETVREVVILTPLIVILALMIGLMLNEKIFFKSMFRGIYFLPVIIISGALLSIMEKNGAFDVVDLTNSSILKMLQSVGLGAIYYILFFLMNNIFTMFWFSGVQILIYLSGLQKISREIYEAARIDGASRWQTFFFLTLPSMSQFTVINVVYTIILMATFSTSQVMVFIKESMFSTAEHYGLGYASALSWIYFFTIVFVLGVFLCVLGYGPKKRQKRGRR